MTFADEASAQQLPPSSISYTTEPAGLITITADGEVIVLSQSNAGAMTVTISGVGFTLVGGEYVRSGYTGQDTLTLRFLTSCSVGGGCPAFGLESENLSDRTRAFRDMSLTTLSMFIASGADVNEQVGNGARGYLLYRLAAGNKPAQFSLLLDAGADVNTVSGNFALLHNAVFSANENAVNLLLSADGIEVNKIVVGHTALDRAAQFYINLEDNTFLSIGASLRVAGGVCMHEDYVGNAEAEPICGTAQQSPNISLPNNANKTFIIRSPDINSPGVIGNLSTPPSQ